RRVHISESIAIATQPVSDEFDGFGQFFPGENGTRRNLYELAQFLFRHQQLTGELDVGYRVFLAFRYVYGNVDVLHIRRDGYLSRVDTQFEIADVAPSGAYRCD